MGFHENRVSWGGPPCRMRVGVACLIVCMLMGPECCGTAPIMPKLMDLSYPFEHDNMLVFPGTEINQFQMSEIHKGDFPASGSWLEHYNFAMGEHIGTHMDAPRNNYEFGWTVDEIPLDRLVSRPAVIVDISARADVDPDTMLSVDDLLAWEKEHGRIPKGAVVFMNSGWSSRFPNRAAFFGMSSEDDPTDIHFPGFDPAAMQWLVDNRDIVGVGVDTASVDSGMNTNAALYQPPDHLFQTHVIMSSNNLYGLEYVNNLDKMTPRGATVHLLPIKLKGGTGGPTRIVASWRRSKPIVK